MTPVLKIFKPALNATDRRELKAFLGEVDEELSLFALGQKGFLSRLTGYVLGEAGKRVRPGLVYICSQFGGAADRDAVRQTAVAVELIHIATLIHDDLVDEAVMRRNKPTVAVKFGSDAAVLLGDHVYAQAFHRLASLRRPELLSLFSETTLAMCEGEIGQLERRAQFDLTESEYLSFLGKKTASLMAASCRAGALLGGLPLEGQRALEVFGFQTGVAFQVVDDILDLEGEEATTGKTLRTDLLNGKMTLPLIHLASQIADGGEKEKFFEVLRNPNGQLPFLLDKVQESGSLDYCRAQVNGLIREAEKALSALPDHPSRRLLTDLARRLSDRKS